MIIHHHCYKWPPLGYIFLFFLIFFCCKLLICLYMYLVFRNWLDQNVGYVLVLLNLCLYIYAYTLLLEVSLWHAANNLSNNGRDYFFSSHFCSVVGTYLFDCTEFLSSST